MHDIFSRVNFHILQTQADDESQILINFNQPTLMKFSRKISELSYNVIIINLSFNK